MSITYPAITFNNTLAALNNRTYDLMTRSSWKYGVSRTVSGTPTFFANGVEIIGAYNFNLTDWL